MQGQCRKPEGHAAAIIDDGFQLEHPALANTRLIFQYRRRPAHGRRPPQTARHQHGTLVAGLVLSATGLAPGAEFIAIRQVSSWTSDMVLAFSMARMLKADIVNSSWAVPLLELFDLLADWLDEARSPIRVLPQATTGRTPARPMRSAN